MSRQRREPANRRCPGPCRALWAVALVGAAATLGSPLAALDPSRLPTQAVQRVWQVADGLPQDSVIALARTADGYLWMGTQEGLVRFDGARLVVFDRANTPALPHATIASLLVGGSGRLWIGTRRGLAWTEGGEFGGFGPEAGLPDARISSLAEETGGRLWVGTLGHGLYRLEGDRFAAVEAVPGRRIRSLELDADGALWVATEMGLARLNADGTATHFGPEHGIAGGNGFEVLVARDGTIWLGTETGLGRRRRDGGWDHWTTAHGLPSDRIRGLAEDDDGNLWIGTEDGGLARFTDGSFTTLDHATGLPSDSVQALLPDAEGNLWVGTSSGGLVRLQDGPFVTFGTAEGLPVDVAMSILEAQDGTVWIGTMGGGLARLAGGITSYGTGSGLPSDLVTSLAEGRDGTLWVGTFGGGLVRWENGPAAILRLGAGLPSDAVNALLVDRQGALWVGTFDAGVVRRATDGTETRYTMADGLPSDVVQALFEARDGALWVGTPEGLGRIADGEIDSWTTADGLPAPSLVAFHETAAGALWIGTAGDGLLRFSDGRFLQLTVRDGLPNDAIFSILEDGRDGLWMSTNRGVFRTTLAELEGALAGQRLTPRLFGVADGLRSAEGYGGSQPSAMRDRRGRLWFSTTRGAAFVDPAWQPPTAAATALFVEQVSAAGVPPAPAPRSLPAGARAVEIRYTTTTLRAPERLTFRYRLEGHDDGWIEAADRRTAFYSRLAGGDYTFHVAAFAPDASAPVAESSTALTVAPALHERPWAQLLVVAMVVFAGGGVHRLRTWRLRRRQRELEDLVRVRTEDLRQANLELERLAAVDGLTGIANRRSLDQALDRAWQDHRRRGTELALMLCDVDHFKAYNDTRGHPAGDEALRTVAIALAASCRRATDLVARYGGEEFAVLLPDTTAADATTLAEHLLAAVRAQHIPHPASSAADHVTLSIGVAALVPTAALTPADLTDRADQALYRAKQTGRNRVVLSESDPYTPATSRHGLPTARSARLQDRVG